MSAESRPGLTPRHSGSLWTTYRVLPKLRVGAGLNYRGAQNPEGARHVRAASFVTADRIYCVYLAANESLIREHARQLGVPATRIAAVRRLIDPAKYAHA